MEEKGAGEMTSHLVPVETILKVDEEDACASENNTTDVNDSGETCDSGTPRLPAGYISIGTQCPPLDHKWKVEPCTDDVPELNSVVEREQNGDNSVCINNPQEHSLLVKPWVLQTDNSCPDQKLYLTSGFPQQFPVDEKFFLQFDYKTRNRLKTKQRRLDPFYRNQERIRQRTVMRIKRQDPRFRAIEREKGRYRMRIKRLDPIFRTQERERQRERMKVKRRDPTFREKEREQQKSRLQTKCQNPGLKEKDRSSETTRTRSKRHNSATFTTLTNVGKQKHFSKVSVDYTAGSAESCFRTCTNNFSVRNDVQDTNSNSITNLLPEHLSSTKVLPPKDSENPESFHYRRPHIFNLNFYSSGKEQWPNQMDLCSKTIAHFNCVKDVRLLNEFNPVSNDVNFLVLKENRGSKESPLNGAANEKPELSNKLAETLPSEVQVPGERHPVSMPTTGGSSTDSPKFNSVSPNFLPAISS